MGRKYELVGAGLACLEYDGYILRNIRALRAGPWGPAGTLGGFVQSENNLSHEGDCWIYDNGKVYEWAKVSESAKVYQAADVRGSAIVTNNAIVGGSSLICGQCTLCGTVVVTGYTAIDAGVLWGATVEWTKEERKQYDREQERD